MSEQQFTFKTENYVKKYSMEKNINEKLVLSETINNNFYVMTINSVEISGKNKGYIIVSEIAVFNISEYEGSKNSASTSDCKIRALFYSFHHRCHFDNF